MNPPPPPLRDRRFLRDLTAALGGTAAAQGITLASMPIVLRLYGPDAYGVQSVFSSVASVVAAVGGLTFPLAIVLAPRPDEARALVKLSLLSCAALALLVSVVLWSVGDVVLAVVDADVLLPLWGLLPLAMVTAVLLATATGELARERLFPLTARALTAQSLGAAAARVGLGAVHPTAAALVAVSALAPLLGTAWMVLGQRLARRREVPGSPQSDRRPPPDDPAPFGVGANELHGRSAQREAVGAAASSSLAHVARTYRDFPLHRAPQVVLNAVAQGLPVVVIAALDGATAAGLFGVAFTVLAVPALLVAGSASDVLYQRLADVWRAGGDVRGVLWASTRAVFYAGVLPFSLVALFGPTLFRLAFGDAWSEAGDIARVIVPWMFLRLLVRPAVMAVPVLGLQRGLLLYEVMSTGTKFLALYAGFAWWGGPAAAVVGLSAVGSIAYLALIVWVLRHSARAATSSSPPSPAPGAA